MPLQKAVQVAPLTLTYGQSPPRKAALALNAALCIAAWNPPDPMPLQKAVLVAPLTLTYGQQPPRLPRTIQQSAIRAQWEVDWNAQTQGKNAAWNVPAVAVPVVPFARPWQNTVAQSWLPPDPQTIKVITKVQPGSDQPPVVGAMTSPEFQTIRAAWELLPNGAQSNPPNAAWNVSAVVVPFTQSWQNTVAQSWLPPDLQPKRATTTVQPGSDQPPVIGTKATTFQAIRAAWELPPNGAQSQAPNAAWNVVTASVPFAQSWWSAVTQSWISADIQPQTLVKAAILAQAIGDQPPIIGAMTAPELQIIRSAWEPPPNTAQSAAPNAGWNNPPLIVPVFPSTQSWQSIVRDQWGSTWNAQSAPPNAGWNFPPPVVSTLIPLYRPWLATVVDSWVPAPPLPPRFVSTLIDSSASTPGDNQYHRRYRRTSYR